MKWHTEQRKINDLIPSENNPRQLTEKQHKDHVIKSIVPNYEIEKLAVKYGEGTWKQATAYFGVILKRSPVLSGSCDNGTDE